MGRALIQPNKGKQSRLLALLYKENHSLYEWFKKSMGVIKNSYDNCAVRQLHNIITGRDHSLWEWMTLTVYHIQKWNCKYHIVFAPKYRRKVFYREMRRAIGKILRQLCEWKGVKIIEAEACPDHIHLFVEIPPKMSVSSFMGYLKGKSSTMLYEQFGELKYKFRNRQFWCRGYYVDTVGKNESRIAEYIQNQLKEDEYGDQMRIPGTSPFTGNK